MMMALEGLGDVMSIKRVVTTVNARVARFRREK